MWFDALTAWLVSIFSLSPSFLKEKTAKSIPAEYWANKELYNKDLMAGTSSKELLRRVKAGRYYIPKEVLQAYPEQHTDPITGQNVIENCELYYSDIMKYDAHQVKQWARKGKYNLSDDEKLHERRRKEREKAIKRNDTQAVAEIDKFGPIKVIDLQNTEAVLQLQRASEAERKYRQNH